jgi:hypothetical protein
MEQVGLLDASTADGSSDLIGMDTELRAVALMNLGIVETWSGQFADAERHVTEGATLAQTRLSRRVLGAERHPPAHRPPRLAAAVRAGLAHRLTA